LPVEIRLLESWPELTACFALQEAIWGRGGFQLASPSVLRAALETGGVVLGAWEERELFGFVCGFAAREAGRPFHWSHLLGVHPARRDRGLGLRLKRAQAEAVAAQGLTEIRWTFDPLAARNAHLNLQRLGARVLRYQRDFYGPCEAGFGTDRLVVGWSPGATGPEAADGVLEGSRAEPDPPQRIEIPFAWERLRHEDPEAAHAWRRRVRLAFEAAARAHARVTGFWREEASGPGFYGLARAAPGEAGIEYRP
jgi:chorismate synthase